MAALRFGSYVAKLSAAPLSPSVRCLTGADVPDTDSALRDLVVDFFRSDSAEYELRAQLLTDLQQMPVEDASVVWSERLSPHQPIAKLTFPAQDPYSPGRRVYGDAIPWGFDSPSRHHLTYLFPICCRGGKCRKRILRYKYGTLHIQFIFNGLRFRSMTLG